MLYGWTLKTSCKVKKPDIKATYYRILYMKYTEEVNSKGQNVDWWSPGAHGRRDWGVTSEYRGFFWGGGGENI